MNTFHRNFQWWGKKSKSYSSKGSQPFAVTGSTKSQSVDSHGYVNPLDEGLLDVAGLPATGKVQPDVEKEKGDAEHGGDIEMADKQKAPEKTATQDKKVSSPTEKKHLSRSLTQPKGTVEYVVSASDTLPGIAARFDTTPSELAKLNRLASRLIFPGQVLFVPDKHANGSASDSKNGSASVESEQEKMTKNGEKDNTVQLPSSVVGLTPSTLQSGDKKELPISDLKKLYSRRHSDRIQRFLKVTSRHFTDGQGVVSGVLIITPNAIMFDPNVSDPLVIEHGAESYGVIAPMDMVIRAAIYTDITLMKVKHIPEGQTLQNFPKPEVYYGRSSVKHNDMSLNKESQPGLEGNTSHATNVVSDKSKSNHEVSQMISQPNLETASAPHIISTSRNGKPCLKDVKVQKELPVVRGDIVVSSDALKSVKSHDQKTEPHHTSDESTLPSAKEQTCLKEKTENIKTVNEQLSDSSTAAESTKESTKPLKENQGPTTGAQIHESVSESRTGEDISQRTDSIEENTSLMEKSCSDLAVGSEKQQTESRRERMLKRLSYPMESITSYTQSSISKILSSSPKTLVDFSSGLFVRSGDEDKIKDVSVLPTIEGEEIDANTQNLKDSSVPTCDDKTLIKDQPDDAQQSKPPEVPVVVYKSMVEEKPELFAALDKLIQRPVEESEGPPLYLCLRMGRPKDKKVQWSTPILSYGKKKIKSEYWFGIPHNRVEDLYNFLQHWAVHLYGEVDDVDLDKLGFIAISDTEEEEEEEEEIGAEAGEDGDLIAAKDDPSGTKMRASPLCLLRLVEDHLGFRSISPTDWEVLSMSDAERATCLENLELPLPELLDDSDILTEEHIKELYTLLPARAVGYPWTLIYSTCKHGFNLKTLYRRMAMYETPVLLVILDTEGAVFGALTSCSLKVSDHFYGTGESFLFTFHPEFKCYVWTGENMYFIKGDADSIAIGAGDGQFGLWLDGDLYRGRSNKCKTYENETLSTKEDFVIKALEAWGFV